MVYTFTDRERSMVAAAHARLQHEQSKLQGLLEGIAAAHDLDYPLTLAEDGTGLFRPEPLKESTNVTDTPAA